MSSKDLLPVNKGTRVLTRFPHFKSMGIFSNTQGQITPQSVVESG